jgi:hypothetical protein
VRFMYPSASKGNVRVRIGSCDAGQDDQSDG